MCVKCHLTTIPELAHVDSAETKEEEKGGLGWVGLGRPSPPPFNTQTKTRAHTRTLLSALLEKPVWGFWRNRNGRGNSGRTSLADSIWKPPKKKIKITTSRTPSSPPITHPLGEYSGAFIHGKWAQHLIPANYSYAGFIHFTVAMGGKFDTMLKFYSWSSWKNNDWSMNEDSKKTWKITWIGKKIYEKIRQKQFPNNSLLRLISLGTGMQFATKLLYETSTL